MSSSLCEPLEEDKLFRDKLKGFLTGVRANNQNYLEADDAAKRVIVARDALLHLEQHLYVPERGTYGDRSFGRSDPTRELRDVFAEQGTTCYACLRGGLVFAHLMRRPGFCSSVFVGSSLPPEFPKLMLRELEVLFEGSRYMRQRLGPRPYWTTLAFDLWAALTLRRSEEMVVATPDRRADVGSLRFRTLMQAIIDGDGEFGYESFLKSYVCDKLDDIELEMNGWTWQASYERVVRIEWKFRKEALIRALEEHSKL